MKCMATIIAGISIAPALLAQERATVDEDSLSAAAQRPAQNPEPPRSSPGGLAPARARDLQMDTSRGLVFDGEERGSSMWPFLDPARFTLKHELGNQINEPYHVSNNRTSFRVEYEK